MNRRECTGGKGATKVVQAICLFVFLATLFPQRALRAETVQPHVVLLSIDGLRPDYYLHPDTYHLKIPLDVDHEQHGTGIDTPQVPVHAALDFNALLVEKGLLSVVAALLHLDLPAAEGIPLVGILSPQP